VAFTIVAANSPRVDPVNNEWRDRRRLRPEAGAD
jgi:hypothetical protein